jgi:hypothetical protein
MSPLHLVIAAVGYLSPAGNALLKLELAWSVYGSSADCGVARHRQDRSRAPGMPLACAPEIEEASSAPMTWPLLD